MPWRSERCIRALFAGALSLLAIGAAQAGALRLCDDPAPLGAAQQDRFLRFAAVVKDTLERSGERVALISRSGLDLSRFDDTLYSHAGVSARANRNAPWSVRQLYYACDESRPRIFDQGVVGFLYGTQEIGAARVSVVFVPGDPGAALERAALDDRRVLRLLGADYSANAYPFAQRYQNCNQWVMEVLATAWGDTDAGADTDARRAAQHWLQQQGYAPTRFAVHPLLSWAGVFVPWLHHDDHPPEAIAHATYQVSMPASIEAFVRARVPGATRVEFCRTEREVVVRRGWAPLPAGCRPGDGDTVVPLA
jgi:hypothetical protein